MPLFEQLGVAQEIEQIGMPKWGAEFVSPGTRSRSSTNLPTPGTSRFRRPTRFAAPNSTILFRNALRKGARGIEGCRVTDVEFTDRRRHRSRASLRDGQVQEWQTRFVVDASGRDTFLGQPVRHQAEQLEAQQRGDLRPLFRRQAIYREKPKGNITVFWFDHGWFWFIPLSDGATSVGAVCWPYYMKTRARRSPTQFFLDTIDAVPGAAGAADERQADLRVTATGNYSYAATATHRPQLHACWAMRIMFIDPMFSSGVLLAMNSAFAGADTVETCPRSSADGGRPRSQVRRDDATGTAGTFSWFIYRVTTPAIRDLFLNPRNYFRLQESLLSLLAGDVFRKTPAARRLLLFKAVYYLKSFGMLRASLRAWKKRRRAIRDTVVEATPR